MMSLREPPLALSRSPGGDRVLAATLSFESNGTVFEAIPRALWHGEGGFRAGSIRIGGVVHVIVARAPDAPRRSLASLLTARELQIAVLIAEGKCDKAVAREIGISENTVREHLRRSFAKLGIEKRTSLVALVVRELPVT
jgi:DNA-binding CsgD family transcriptional regulator